MLFALIAGTTLFLRHRIVRNQRQLRADLQAIVDLEARAVARNDRELFLSLKSPDDLAWLQEQQGAFDYFAAHPGDWPRVKVTSVELVDDYAWVQTTSVWEVLERIRNQRSCVTSGLTYQPASPLPPPPTPSESVSSVVNESGS